MSKSEAQTRVEHIDKLLALSGWNVKAHSDKIGEGVTILMRAVRVIAYAQ